MKPKIILFVVGILVLLTGVYPLLPQFGIAEEFVKSLPLPGSTVYQVLLALLGIIALGYSLRGEKPAGKELLKALGK